MKQSSKSNSYQKNRQKLQGLVRKTAPLAEERILHDTVVYFYSSQPLITYKRKGNNLIIQTLGRTTRQRRKSLSKYMTLLGNIKVRPQQPFPVVAIQTILTERKDVIDRNPGKKSIYTAFPAHTKNGRPVPRHEKTAERIRKAEQRYPTLKKITKHPAFGPWVLPIATTLEVAAGLLALFVVLPWLTSLLPEVDIPLPDINLPDWKLPFSFSLPDLPAWLNSFLYWLGKTLPIWVALYITVRAVQRKDRQQRSRKK